MTEPGHLLLVALGLLASVVVLAISVWILVRHERAEILETATWRQEVRDDLREVLAVARAAFRAQGEMSSHLAQVATQVEEHEERIAKLEAPRRIH